MSAPNQPLWQAADMLQLPELAGEIRADVCVVGLGGSGLSCIRELLAAGKRVVGIDAISVAGGAAGRNGGFLLGGLALFHHDAVARLGRSAAVSLYEETLNQIDRIAEETPDAVSRSGSLRLARSADEFEDCRLQYEAMQRDGLPAEPYEGSEGTGLFFPRDAAFDPAARCVALALDALWQGARLYARSPLVAIGDGIVQTPNGAVRAATVVIAVDGKLETILPELSPRVRSARLQMLATEPATDVNFSRPIYARWGLDYWQQLADGRIVLGGCRDVGGDAEWTADPEPTAVVQAALDNLVRDIGTSAPVSHRWAATVGYTQSGLPIIEEVRPGVWAIGAYSGMGNVVGALCGRAVAELITERKSSLAELFRP